MHLLIYKNSSPISLEANYGNNISTKSQSSKHVDPKHESSQKNITLPPKPPLYLLHNAVVHGFAAGHAALLEAAHQRLPVVLAVGVDVLPARVLLALAELAEY